MDVIQFKFIIIITEVVAAFCDHEFFFCAEAIGINIAGLIGV